MARIRADSFRQRLWFIPEPSEHQPIPESPYPDFVTKLLRRRGITTAEAARQFLFDTPTPLPDATLLPGAGAALDRIERAIRAEETIAVYGDFDVDGVTAAVILTEAIRALGGRVVPYLPDRFQEGYGLHCAALTRLKERYDVTLVITVDCGLSSVAEVEHANAQGQAVVIIDHHTIPVRLPAAVAIVNPKLPGSAYGFSDLSAGGVAYRLAPALLARFGRSVEAERWIDLATLSTIADVAPLTGENRRLVHDGLEALRDTRRPGIQALLTVAGYAPSDVDAEAVAYGLTPRLNAAGRLEHAMQAFNLLIETVPERAMEQALALDRLNLQRRQLTVEAMERATALLRDEDPDSPVTFLGDAQISSGIIGLVAGRLAEERYRPAVIYEAGPEECRASCRSIPEFDVAAALKECADLLQRHGGHRAAAGFTARTAAMPALKQRFTAIAREQLAGVPLQPRLEVDAQVPLQAVQGLQVSWLQRLAPFGEGNRPPTFVSTGVTVAEVRRVGADQSHLRLVLRDGEAVWVGIGFGLGGAPCRPGDRVDVVWSLRRNGPYGGYELEVRDLAAAQGP